MGQVAYYGTQISERASIMQFFFKDDHDREII